MIKYIEYNLNDPGVEIELLYPGILEKTAEYSDELQNVLNDIKPKEGKYYLLVNALGSSEYYGCFFKDQLILTENGYKDIQNININDKVLTHKGNFKEVLKIFKLPFNGKKTSIYVQNLPGYQESTFNHPYMVLRADKLHNIRKEYYKQKINRDTFLIELSKLKYDWINAEDIKPGDYVYKPIVPNQINVPIYSEDDAYLFGYYLSEGCLSKEYRNIKTKGEYKKLIFVFSETDINMIDKLEKITHHIYITSTISSDKTFRVEYSNKEKAILVNKLFGHHSTKKFIHPNIFNQSEEWKLKFIAAYIDGDGSVIYSNDKYNRTIHISTASRKLALDIQRLLASVNIVSSISESQNLIKNGCFGKRDHDIYQVNIGSNYSYKLLQHTLRLKENYLPSKRSELEQGGFYILPNNYMLMKVKKTVTEEITDTFKYNLEVKEDNSYVVDFIGHNSNRNGDSFPEKSLKEYHKTFETNANVYIHHKNKPKLGHRIYGKVLHSHYNEKMHRVELVIELDIIAAPDIKERIDKKENVAVSMGCRVKFDECSICGNKAPKIEDYCIHLKTQMGQILSDGRKVYAINNYPKFFDISFVRIPADRTGYMMAKVASNKNTFSISSIENAKNAGIKEADIVKLIEGGKTISGSSDPKRLIINSQPEMPKEMIKNLTDKNSLSQIFSTLLGMRIMPSRRDFQKLVLYSTNKQDIADEYDSKNMVFQVNEKEEPKIPNDVHPRFFHSDTANIIREYPEYLRKAPLTKPVVIIRIMEKMANHQEGSMMEQKAELPLLPIKNPTWSLVGLGSLYYGFSKLMTLVDNATPMQKIIVKNPWLLPILVGGTSLGAIALQKSFMEKKAAIDPGWFIRTALAVPATYVWSGHAEAQKQRGKQISPYSDLVRKQPLLMGLGHGLLGGFILKNVDRGVGKLKKFASIREDRLIDMLINLSSEKFDKIYNEVIT